MDVETIAAFGHASGVYAFMNTAYGWPASTAYDQDESNRRLLELNRAIAAGEIGYSPFG